MRTPSRWAALLLSSVAAAATAQAPGGGRGYGPDTYPSYTRYGSPPDSTGDRGAFYALLAKAGLRAPSGAARVRLVHLVSEDRRSEIMIIYAEASSAIGALSRDELAELIGRARVGLHVTRR